MWTFIQDQILGMKWLNGLIEKLLSAFGLDTGSRIVGSVQFFLYDVIKIPDLIYPELLSSGAEQKDHGQISWCGCEYRRGFAWDSNAFLFLLIYTDIHGIYQCRTSSGSDVFVPDIIPDG